MVEDTQSDLPDFSMNASGLYTDATYTDTKVGSIRCLTPVNADGTPDDTRPALFSGQSQLMTPAGALPINFEIDAKDLAEAVDKFGGAAQQGVEDTFKQLEEMRREQASQIVVPGQEGMGGMGGQGAPGSGIFMP